MIYGMATLLFGLGLVLLLLALLGFYSRLACRAFKIGWHFMDRLDNLWR